MGRTVRRALTCALACLPLAAPAGAGAQEPATHRLASPDGELVVEVELDDAGAASYRVTHRGAPLLARSALGLRLEGGPPLDGDFAVRSARRTSHDAVWRPVWGEYRTIRNRYEELTLDLREQTAPRRALQVVFRVFDDGVGFRYVLPRQRALRDFAITAEDTEFAFAGDFRAWWIAAEFGPGIGDEQLWRETPLSEMDAAATPVTVDAGPAGYATLHEAHLDDYATMHVEPAVDREGASPPLRAALVERPDGVAVRGSAPHQSPWRTLVVGDTPGDLIESTLTLNLNPRCAICDEDTSWIRPGTYVGIWWELHKGVSTWETGGELPHGATTENAKRYIDFAAARGIPYVLTEGWNEGWATGRQDFLTPTPDFDLEEVVAYAQRRGVGWMAHNETSGDVSNYERQIEPAYALYERLGVPALKTGYAGGTTLDGVEHAHYDQVMVNHYRDTIRRAAEHRLMVEAHEIVKDTGERRTWPNLMTREAVRGMEYEAWSEGNPPEHTVTIPFTRMVAGPVSYTPGIFEITWDPGGPGRPPWRTEERTRVHTTRAGQLAIYPVYLSGLQMLADVPEHYEGRPEFEFLERVPTTWDDTRVLNAQVGDFVTVARRSGRDWFVGSMTDEQEETLGVPLGLLQAGTPYVANVYGDAAGTDLEMNPDEVEISRFVVERGDELVASMAAGGGQAVHLTPATAQDVRELPRCGAGTPLCEPGE